MPGGRRRNSIVNRRLSNSFESRKSSSQDTGFNRVRYQNTYRTCPENSEIFQPFRFEPRIYDILERTLHGKKYDPHKVAVLTKELTQEISREARCTLTLSPRYKLITHVALIENKGYYILILKQFFISILYFLGQDVRLGSRCLWDTNYDNMASATYKNSSIYAVGTVYAVYFE